MIGEEEKKIRQDPASAAAVMARKVFGALDRGRARNNRRRRPARP
jgi:hypothetical protein